MKTKWELLKRLLVVVLFIGAIVSISECGLAAEAEVHIDDEMSADNDLAVGYDCDDTILDLSFEELMNIEVESAGFFKTTAGKAPGYVLVYDRKTLDEPTVRTLADLIELHVPGAVMGGHQRQGRLMGVRGLQIDNNAKTLVMWDGQQINYRSHFGYMIGMLSPFMGDMERVEIIHGPGAIQHGSGAISGFINMIPKNGTDNEGFFANYEYGVTEQSNLIEAGYGFNYGEGRDLYFYAGGYDARGFELNESYGYQKPQGTDVDAFGYERNNYRFSTTWNHDNFNLNWFLYSLTPNKNSYPEGGIFTNTTMGIRPKYTWEINDTESVDFVFSLAYMDFLQRGANGDVDNMLGGAERHMEYKTVFKTTRFDHHQIAIGALFGEKRFYDGYTYLHDDPVRGFESVQSSWKEVGVFGEDVISLRDDLTMSLGLRYDKYRTNPVYYKEPMSNNGNTNNGFTPGEMDGHFSPRIALAYEMNEKTNVKLSYQHGFRMPDAAYYTWNLYNNAAASALGFPNSPRLEPEEMDSYELNISRTVNDKLDADLNLFFNTFKNQLTWGGLDTYWTADQIYNPTPAIDSINEWTPAASWGWYDGGMFQNVEGKYHIWGSELSLKYDIADNLTADVSYGLAKVMKHKIEQRYPTHQVKAHLESCWLDDKLKLGMSYLYNSQYSTSMNSLIHESYKDSRNVFDFYAIYYFTENCLIRGAVKNAFGDQTPPSGYLMNEPQWGNIGYTEPRYYLSMELRF